MTRIREVKDPHLKALCQAIYCMASNFHGSNFREIVKNHMNVKFRDKIFMIATFFVITSTWTIHVAPPTILTRGIGARKCEEKRIEIMLSRFEF